MSSPDLPQLFFSNRFCPNLSAIVVSEILMGTEEMQLPCAKLFYHFFFFKQVFHKCQNLTEVKWHLETRWDGDGGRGGAENEG